jgi:hypothetical protein
VDDGVLAVRNHEGFLSFLNSDNVKEEVNWEYANKKLAEDEYLVRQKLEKSKRKWAKESKKALSMIQRVTSKIFEDISLEVYAHTGTSTDAVIFLKERMENTHYFQST